MIDIAGQDAELPEIRSRTRVFTALVLLGLGALVTRLFYLQIMRGDAFYAAIAQSIVRTVPVPALRGDFRDRKGRPLATTRPAFNLVVTPAHVSREGYMNLRRLLGPDFPDLPSWKRIEEMGRTGAGRTVVVAQDLAQEQMAAIATAMDIPGITIETEARRFYPQGSLFAHTVGYTAAIPTDDLRKKKDEGYRPGDRIGRTGLERLLESTLRGQPGFDKLVVDRRGRPLPGIDISDLVTGPVHADPVPGPNVILTLDLDAQAAAAKAFGDQRSGGVVVVEVDTGRVLVMLSAPAFDPNILSGKVSSYDDARLAGDPRRIFRDKTVADTYNPGSTFKLITALSGLEAGILKPEAKTFCNGSVEYGKRRFHCMHQHGSIELHHAIVESCNVFFYELGARPGMMANIVSTATALGLGQAPGLGINGESAGLVPDEAWHRRRDGGGKGAGFSIGHALNTAIGEGDTRVTAMQMALAYAALANGGTLYEPQLVERVEDGSGHVLAERKPRIRRTIPMSPDTKARLHAALTGVVNDPHGTAYRARSRLIEVAGKTGTAHSFGSGPGVHTDHAWFAGFAPAEAPKIAFAVVVENGGLGGEVAAPIAMTVANSLLAPPPPPPVEGHDEGQDEGTGEQGAHAGRPADPEGKSPEPPTRTAHLERRR
jgi:penicillin-binding protein 2